MAMGTTMSLSLLRALPITKVQARGGKILYSNEGTAQDYELSQPVGHIDAFLSHTWSTPRWKKYLTLVLYNNLLAAFLVSLCCSAFACVLVCAGVLPLLDLHAIDEARSRFKFYEFEVGATCQLVGIATFLLALLTWHEALNICSCCRTPMLFLDKACVHQTDPALKQQGIRNLAGFLRRSRNLVILYTDAYMNRLWTVYELATFMLQCKGRRVDFLSVEITILLTCAMAIDQLWMVIISFLPLDWLLSAPWRMETKHFLICLPRMVGMSFVMMRSATVMEGIFKRLAEFDIKTAECTCEADRPLVLSSVEAFVKATCQLPAGAGQDTALEAFNHMVHRRVPRLMIASLGTVGIRYKVAVMFFVHNLYYPMDHIAAWWRSESSDPTCLLLSLYTELLEIFVLGPLRVAAAAWLARLFARRCPKRFWFGVVVNAVSSELIWYLLRMPLGEIYLQPATLPVVALARHTLVGALLVAVTIASYGHAPSTVDKDGELCFHEEP